MTQINSISWLALTSYLGRVQHISSLPLTGSPWRPHHLPSEHWGSAAAGLQLVHQNYTPAFFLAQLRLTLRRVRAVAVGSSD